MKEEDQATFINNDLPFSGHENIVLDFRSRQDKSIYIVDSIALLICMYICVCVYYLNVL